MWEISLTVKSYNYKSEHCKDVSDGKDVAVTSFKLEMDLARKCFILVTRNKYIKVKIHYDPETNLFF